MPRALATGASLALLAACSDYDLHRPDKQNPPADDPVEDTGPLLEPDIAVSPDTLDFGDLPRGCAAPGQDLTITNEGEAPLEVTGIEPTGEGKEAFSVTDWDGAPFSLAPGEARTFSVAYAPPYFVDYAIEIEVTSDDPDEPRVEVAAMGQTADDAVFEQTFTQDIFEQVDILWVVDNSGSMSDDQQIVAQNFETFIQVFIDLGLDYHMGVVTTDMDDPNQSGRLLGEVITPATADPVGTFGQQVNVGATGSGSEQGFEATQAALTEPLLSGHNAGFLREDAALSVIVVSDEDNSSFQQAASFVSWFEALKPEPRLTTFSAICEDLFISCYQYAEATELTDGITGDIASSDYATVMDEISVASAGITDTVPLEQEPSDVASMVVTLEGAPVPQDATDGWTYHSTDNEVTFHGAYLPEPGESGTISYPVAGECP